MTTPFGTDPGDAETVLARLRERGFASEADSLAGWLASDLPEAVALEADAVSTVPLSSAERLRRGWMIAISAAPLTSAPAQRMPAASGQPGSAPTPP